MLQLFGYISGILIAVCFIPYIRDILLLKTKPQRASWLIWTVLGGIAFFSQIAEGASYSLWLPGINTLGIAIVFLLSLKYGVGGLNRRDYIALFISFLGLILWYFSQEAAIALFIAIAVDTVGGILTIHKAYQDPASETMITWIIASVSGFFGVLAVGSWDIILLCYPFYILLVNAAVAIAIYLGKQSIAKNNK